MSAEGFHWLMFVSERCGLTLYRCATTVESSSLFTKQHIERFCPESTACLDHWFSLVLMKFILYKDHLSTKNASVCYHVDRFSAPVGGCYKHGVRCGHVAISSEKCSWGLLQSCGVCVHWTP